MKKSLILQGWYQKPESNWYPWLKKELEERGYEVYIPDLPTMHTDLPDMRKQLDFIERNFRIDKDTLVFGHSLGTLLAMRLAEKHQYKKMFLIAGWDYDDLTIEHRLFWKNKINHTKIKENVEEIHCISSDNDPYTTASQNEAMSKRFGGKNITIKSKGHFTEKDGITKIPELLKYI